MRKVVSEPICLPRAGQRPLRAATTFGIILVRKSDIADIGRIGPRPNPPGSLRATMLSFRNGRAGGLRRIRACAERVLDNPFIDGASPAKIGLLSSRNLVGRFFDNSVNWN